MVLPLCVSLHFIPHRAWRAMYVEGFVFGGLLSLFLLAFISWIFLLSSLPCMYISFRRTSHVYSCSGGHRKWCLMRASDMQDMGLWRRNHLCDENKSVRALFGQQSFPFQSCTRLRVFPSIRALAPFLGGSSDETVRFQRSSSPARVAVFTLTGLFRSFLGF